MFEDAVSDKTLSLIGSIGDGVQGFYLAGGTGLALQLGHRVSEDLGFFPRRHSRRRQWRL
jgi:hypothetical protein